MPTLRSQTCANVPGYGVQEVKSIGTFRSGPLVRISETVHETHVHDRITALLHVLLFC